MKKAKIIAILALLSMAFLLGVQARMTDDAETEPYTKETSITVASTPITTNQTSTTYKQTVTTQASTTTIKSTTTNATTITRPTTTTKSTTNIPLYGVIRVTKANIDTAMGNYSLAGAVFEVRDSSGNLVDTITTDEDGIAITKALPPDNYIVLEIIAPYGFIRNPEPFRIQLMP